MPGIPKIAVTIGDAAGIGPEVVLKAVSDRLLLAECLPVVVGDSAVLRRTAEVCGLDCNLESVASEEELLTIGKGPVLFDLANIGEEFAFGVESAKCGKAAGEFIEKSVALWKGGFIDAISTAPLSKRSLALGGYTFPGHTEFLAALTGTERFAMSFFAGDLRVLLMSTHLPLRDAIEKVTTESLLDLIRFADEQISKLIGRKARIAVSGLNPHASENGMFGEEEASRMNPAIEMARAEQIEVSGPHSADTVFLRGFKGEFDAVIACYHDQATIAVKCLSFGAGVNVTLGLPLIRTSVDHGTAFEIAGKNSAEADSMKTAIKLAAKLATMNQQKARDGQLS